MRKKIALYIYIKSTSIPSVHPFHMELSMCAKYTSRERYRIAENGFPLARRSWRTFWQHGYTLVATSLALKCITVKDTYRMSEPFDRVTSLTRHGEKIRKQLFVDLSNTEECYFRVTYRSLPFKIARVFAKEGSANS